MKTQLVFSLDLHYKSTPSGDPGNSQNMNRRLASVPKTLKQNNLEKKDIRRKYAPLPSVWYGEDAALLERLLSFYPRKQPNLVVDATVNGGRFWRHSTRTVVGIDIDPKHRPTIVADNTRLPLRNELVDIIVYDPPHIPNQGKDKQKDFNVRFGLVLKSPRECGYNFSHTYPSFLREAYRVLKPEGILFCKITDYIHDHR